MSEDYEDELVTSHSDEDPELNQNTERKPMILPSTEGSAVSELYTKDRDSDRNPFQYKPRAGENVIEEEIYIPDVE